MKPLTLSALACIGSLVAVTAVSAQQSTIPAPAAKNDRSQCFFISQYQQWRDVDDKTIYIRVNLHDYYRLDMASSCPELTYPEAHLVTTNFGSETMCTALDWDLRVANGTGRSSFAIRCIVNKMTKLTPAEAAAVPAKYKPD